MKIVGSAKTKELILQTLEKLPEEIRHYLLENVWFLSSSPDSWAYTFRGSEIPDKYLIIFSDELFHEPLRQIQFTILHEIGHVLLKHRNSINYHQSKQEIAKQELEADQFADNYL